MIDISFVNGTVNETSVMVSSFLNDVKAINESVDEAIANYEDHYSQFVIESKVNGYEDLEEVEALEAEGNNIFAKIGNAIIAILRKFKDKIKSILGRGGFADKSDLDKIDAFVKAHPSMKDQVVAHANDFNMKDIQSLAEMEKAFNEIMRMSEPKSIKSRWAKVKEGSNTAVNVAKGVTTVLGAVTAIKVLNSEAVKRARSAYETASRTESDIESRISSGQGDQHVLRAQQQAASEYTTRALNTLMTVQRNSNSILGKIRNLAH